MKATLLAPVEIDPDGMPLRPGESQRPSSEAPPSVHAASRPIPTVVAQPPTMGSANAVPVADPTTGPRLTLPEAIETAFRLQPSLRVYLENIQQARGQADVAFAPFLPMVTTAYSVGGFDLNVGGRPASFAFLPPGAVIPVGLNIQSGYELAELRLQWLICDFGRRLGRYRQAELGLDIAQLQTDRAYQTVANEVAVAYYQVLRAQSLLRIAQEAVRRAEDDLQVARKLGKGGVLVRETVLRSEVQLAQSQKALDSAEEGIAIAVAGLNLAIGLNVSTATAVEGPSQIPPLPPSLAECLQTAAARRRELNVARTSIQVAQEGRRVARADFAPRIVTEGALTDLQQASPRAHLDLPIGFIKLEWGLFEGGKRVGELRIADSKTRAAVAEADSVADTISYQVTETYQRMATARKSIDRDRPAVEQTQENYRLVLQRLQQGAATPSDIVDAETALTRAQQDYQNSIYNYLTTLARLEYAMGVAPTRGNR